MKLEINAELNETVLEAICSSLCRLNEMIQEKIPSYKNSDTRIDISLLPGVNNLQENDRHRFGYIIPVYDRYSLYLTNSNKEKKELIGGIEVCCCNRDEKTVDKPIKKNDLNATRYEGIAMPLGTFCEDQLDKHTYDLVLHGGDFYTEFSNPYHEGNKQLFYDLIFDKKDLPYTKVSNSSKKDDKPFIIIDNKTPIVPATTRNQLFSIAMFDSNSQDALQILDVLKDINKDYKESVVEF